mmetsp:Transcript_2967/g.6523  ORF Transcript_2967/g.6523 Transcript_2967/m.6523 type:complete len:311 (-) Transcript_2967:242-1174(-)
MPRRRLPRRRGADAIETRAVIVRVHGLGHVKFECQFRSAATTDGGGGVDRVLFFVVVISMDVHELLRPSVIIAVIVNVSPGSSIAAVWFCLDPLRIARGRSDAAATGGGAGSSGPSPARRRRRTSSSSSPAIVVAGFRRLRLLRGRAAAVRLLQMLRSRVARTTGRPLMIVMMRSLSRCCGCCCGGVGTAISASSGSGTTHPRRMTKQPPPRRGRKRRRARIRRCRRRTVGGRSRRSDRERWRGRGGPAIGAGLTEGRGGGRRRRGAAGARHSSLRFHAHDDVSAVGRGAVGLLCETEFATVARKCRGGG